MAKYIVLSDTREQTPWKFIRTDYCDGTEVATLSTGDYTLKGLEDKFVLERKGSAAEFYNNICTADKARFEREMVRLSLMPHSYIILEFTLNDILKFPHTSALPARVKKAIGNKGDYYLRRFLEIQTQYRVPIILAGAQGKETAISLFKRVNEIYAVSR